MNKHTGVLVFVVSLLLSGSGLAQSSHLDSLFTIYEQGKSDSVKAKMLNHLFDEYNEEGYLNDKALSIAKEALDISEKVNYIDGAITAYLNLGDYYEYKGDYKQDLNYLLKSLDIAEKANYKIRLGDICSHLAGFYTQQMKNYPKALEYAAMGIKALKDIGCRNGILLSLLNNTGAIYYNMNNDTLALQNYLEALDVEVASNDTGSLADLENNIGSVYNDLKIYDKAIDYYNKALNVYQKTKDNADIAMSYINIGNALNLKGNAEEGIKYATNALSIARGLKDKQLTAYAYNCLAESYSKMGDFQKAYQFQLAFSGINDTLYSEASSKQVNDMQVKYDTEKKEKENKILELNIKRERIINYSISVGLILVLALVFFVYRSYINKKKAHAQLEEKNKVIEQKNKEVLDSITYAKRLQDAILPPLSIIKKYLPESFLLYKPKDIVAGDFYWMERAGDTILIAACDCTGHGVPGAMVSVVCSNALNRTVKEFKITEPGRILDKVRELVLETFEKSESEVQDGMDISLCCLNTQTKEIQWSGANNPLWYIQNGELKEVAPDKQPIGRQENAMPFNTHSVKMKKGDILYLFTDGYADQFGGPSGKKFKYKQLQEKLLTMASMSMEKQKEVLEEAIESWKGSLEQVDDILIMGIKV